MLSTNPLLARRARTAVCAFLVVIVSGCGGGSSGTDAAPAHLPAHRTSGQAEQPSEASATPWAATIEGAAAPLPAPLSDVGIQRSVPAPLYGVTIDDISGLSNILQALGRLSKTPTSRIVFDEFVAPGYYRDAAVAISKVSYVMGEVLDSQYVNTVSVRGYLDRTRQYLDALGDVVDIWEVGNEINGEWLGGTASVVAKMSGAYDLVKARGKTTALTLYYNEDCWSRRSNEMFTWAQANIPSRMKHGLDYVLVSYYEDDCNHLRPDWPAVFRKLAKMFPRSKIGFGEVGTTRASEKARYLTRYYTMDVPVPNYIGGYFWWYFRQDMVPHTKPLWRTLNAALSER